MADISLSSIDLQQTPQTSHQNSIHITNIVTRLDRAMEDIKQTNHQCTQMKQKVVEALDSHKYNIEELKKQDLQAHRKCLQHIEILLYQRDYAQALAKIDKYKKLELTDSSFQFQNTLSFQIQEDISKGSLAFEKAKALICNPFVNFQVKQKIWLYYSQCLQQSDCSSQQKNHVTYEEVEKAMAMHFKKEFDIMSSVTEIDEKRKNIVTPEKKNSRSVSILKSNQKNKNSNKKMDAKQYEKSTGKALSANKVSNQKKTERKRIRKQTQQAKTSKKLTPFIA